MAHFPKPAEGSWTEHYPGLGTGPISYRDSYDPDVWQDEIDTIFTKEWLNVGREIGDGLQFAVVVDLELFARQIGDEAAFAVDDRGIDGHRLDTRPELGLTRGWRDREHGQSGQNGKNGTADRQLSLLEKARGICSLRYYALSIPPTRAAVCRLPSCGPPGGLLKVRR